MVRRPEPETNVYESMSKQQLLQFTLEEYEPNGDMSLREYQYLNGAHYMVLQGLLMNGYHPETNQSALQLWIRQGDTDLDVLQNEVELALKYTKPLTKASKDFDLSGECCMFSVFEHTLSQFGFYDLIHTCADGRWHLGFTRYGHSSVKQSFGDLRAVLEYVYQHHPYEFLRDVESDDDDGDEY